MSSRSAYYRTISALAIMLSMAVPAQAELVVYTAQLIRTMEPALPTATVRQPDPHQGETS